MGDNFCALRAQWDVRKLTGIFRMFVKFHAAARLSDFTNVCQARLGGQGGRQGPPLERLRRKFEQMVLKIERKWQFLY